MDYEKLVAEMRRLALEAGDKIMEIYGQDNFEVKSKSDDSPVTAADEAADAIGLVAERNVLADLEVTIDPTRTSIEQDRAADLQLPRDLLPVAYRQWVGLGREGIDDDALQLFCRRIAQSHRALVDGNDNTLIVFTEFFYQPIGSLTVHQWLVS